MSFQFFLLILIFTDYYFKGRDSSSLFKNKPQIYFSPFSLAWRSAVSMETGCNYHASLWLGPAGGGERAWVHRLREGKRAWDGWDGWKRGETWAQPQGGGEECLVWEYLWREIYFNFLLGEDEKCHKMNNISVCVWLQVPRDVSESEMFGISGKPCEKDCTNTSKISQCHILDWNQLRTACLCLTEGVKLLWC